MQRTTGIEIHGPGLNRALDRISEGSPGSRKLLARELRALALTDDIAIATVRRLQTHNGVSGSKIAILSARGALGTTVRSAADLVSLARD